MSLKKYREKRNFDKTPEPLSGITKSRFNSSKSELVYVIQRHRALHLHYDLRLEEKGVLKSWAIPKAPPLVLGIKRLAVQTEDHPLGYEKFEGTIPEGEYGGGTVEIWDKGVYVPLKISASKKIIELNGNKLKGMYALIKLKPGETGDNNWLFFKMKNKTK